VLQSEVSNKEVEERPGYRTR